MRGEVSLGGVFVPTLLSIVAIMAVEVPVAVVLSHRIGVEGVWIAYPAAFCTMLVLQMAFYRLVWRKREIRRLI